MSSGAVAASDPGGGEPKLVPGADVEMTKAAEEAVVAPVAGVELEGKVGEVAEGDAAAVVIGVEQDGGDLAAAAMGVEQDGGDAAVAVSDPTGLAGMVTEEGHGDVPAEEVHRGGGEEKVQAGAGGLHGEAGGNPFAAEDVAAPAFVEAVGSATDELTVAEPGSEIEETDNGVVHYDKEVQNNVPGDVAGSSKTYEDNGSPVVDQLNGRSEMFPQTVHDVPYSETTPSSNEAASSANVTQCARYCLPPPDTGGFRVTDLVWGKVKSHPWWPGEIFDPSDASDLALKHQKKGSYLVSYFGDSTFAWCDESQLRPFVTNYSQMEKQSSSDAFVASVNNALEELSRRILSGMSCSCLPEELSDTGMSYTVENAGLKDGVTCSVVNRFEILKCFSPENLLHYIKELALFPGQGGDLLELVIACSQLTSFYRSKGCSELASFQTGDAWVEDGMDTQSTQNVIVEEAVINEVQPTQEKPKRGRGRPRKQKPECDQEVMEKKYTSNLNVNTYHDTVGSQMGMEFDNFENLDSKKKRNLDLFVDSEKSSTPTVGSSFKIGECIRRAASQLAGSASIVKAQNEPTVHKSTAEAENGEFDVVSDYSDDELTALRRAKKRRMYRNHTADPNDLLSQLCIASTEPMNGHSFSAMIISYFSDYRNYVVSTATEASIIEKSTSKRGRKRKVLPSPEVETTDHMQDSYWSGLSLHNHPIHNLTNESSSTRPRRKRRSSRQTYVPLSELGASPKKQIHVIERSIIHVDEKMVDELKPTALVLSFGRSAHVPSEMELIKMFSRYGPLRETDTEVDNDTNTVKVVFKKRSDAERAFSVAGKYGTFGPSLRSYRLVNMPFSLRTSQAKNPETHPEDRGPKVSGPSESSVPQDAIQVDQVDKTDKAEVVDEPAVEQVETAKQTSQMEAASKALMNQVDLVEKIGLVDAELTGLVPFGTGAQAESVAEDPPEQVSFVEQACTEKEASVEGVSGSTQSDAATDASNGSLISRIQLAEAPNQALIDVTTNTLQMEVASEAQTEDTVKQALHADATNDEPTQMVSDNTKRNIVAEAPKQGHVSEDNAGIEQKMGSEAPKQVSDETPCTSELEAEILTAEQVGLGSVEQIKGESQTAVEILSEQTYSIDLSVQVGDVTEASGAQIEVEGHTPEDKSIVDAIMEHTVMVQKTLESKIEVPVEESVDVIEASGAQIELEGHTPEEKSIADAIMEDTVMVQETLESKVEVPVEESVVVTEASGALIKVEGHTPEDKSISDVIMEHTVMVQETLQSKVEVPVEESVDNIAAVLGQVEETAEEQATVEGIYEKIKNEAAAEDLAGETEGGKTAADTPKEKAEDKVATESSAGKTREGETAVEAPEFKADSKDIVEPLARENAVGESTAEAAEEETGAAGETVEDVRALKTKTTTDENISESAIIVTPFDKTTTGEETVDDAVVETPDEKTLEVEKTVEDATVGAPDWNFSTSEKTTEDTMVDAQGVQAAEAPEFKADSKAIVEPLARDNAAGEITAEAPEEETRTAEGTVEDVMALQEKTTTDEKILESATIVTPFEKTTTCEETVDDAAVETPDGKTIEVEKTVEDATVVGAPDGKSSTSEKTTEDTKVDAQGVQAGANEQTS